MTKGLCHCGCGQQTRIAARTRLTIGHVRGQPLRFISSHNSTKNKNIKKMFIEDGASGCWNWIGRINRYGYFGPIGAHRVMYEKLKGKIQDGLQLDHLCRNKKCVNPNHLEPVTQVENSRRAAPKITREKVKKIFTLRKAGMIQREIAALVGCTRRHVGNILEGRCWRGVA